MTLQVLSYRQRRAAEMYRALLQAGAIDRAQHWAMEAGRLFNQRMSGEGR